MRRNTRNRNQKRKNNSDIDYTKTRRILIFIVLILLVISLGTATFYYFRSQRNYQNLVETSKKEIEEKLQTQEENSESEEEVPTDITFTMAAIGDIMCHNTQYLDAYQSDSNTYDFSYVFEDISFYTKTADICVGNLETTFAGEERGYRSYPTFNSPDSLAYELKDIGVDVLSTAGNHALDMGFDGLSRTIDVLNDADIAHTGTYQSQEDQSQILFKYVKGVKIAFLNYTYGTNGIPIPSGKEFCVNLIDKDFIKSQIDSAKSQNADIIVACMHWGSEYRTTPNEQQTQLADFLIENDVNIILGTHPHVLEPMEKRTVTLEDGSTKEGFVIYSLGNFISDQNAKNTRNSIILNLTITKHVDGSVSVDKTESIPIYMYKDTSLKTRKMKLLDINKQISNYENGFEGAVDKKVYDLLKTELSQLRKTIKE